MQKEKWRRKRRKSLTFPESVEKEIAALAAKNNTNFTDMCLRLFARQLNSAKKALMADTTAKHTPLKYRRGDSEK